MHDAALPAPSDRSQPRGLYVLCLTETWERFSFYGMQGLLIFYMTQHFLLADAAAYAIFGSYLAVINTAPLLGGHIADRWLGYRKSILLGGLLLAAGHFAMAYEGEAAVRSADGIIRDDLAFQVMLFALSLIAVGTGFLKPSISAALGQLYAPDDARRDRGFALFFLGLNFGGVASSLVVGYLGQSVSWSLGFGAAGVGMLIGLLIFIGGKRHLEGRAEPPVPAVLARRLVGPLRVEQAIGLGAIAAAGLVWLLLQLAILTAALTLVGASVAIGWLVYLARTRLSAAETGDLWRSAGVILLVFLFFTAVLQTGTSVALFLERNVDKQLGPWTIQAAQFPAVTGIAVILLIPAVNYLWARLAARGLEPSSLAKMALGFLAYAIAFGTYWLAGWQATDPRMVALGLVIPALIITGIGELLVVPTSLSLVTRLAPPRLAGLMLGLWSVAVAAAGLAASRLAALTSVDVEAAGADLPRLALAAYVPLFAAVALACGLVAASLAGLAARQPHRRRSALQALAGAPKMDA